jgi:hypothetical protein
MLNGRSRQAEGRAAEFVFKRRKVHTVRVHMCANSQMHVSTGATPHLTLCFLPVIITALSCMHACMQITNLANTIQLKLQHTMTRYSTVTSKWECGAGAAAVQTERGDGHEYQRQPLYGEHRKWGFLRSPIEWG